MDIILSSIVLLGYVWNWMFVFGWCTVDIILLNIVPLRIVFGWCILAIILLNIVLLKESVWMVHCGYHPLKHRSLRIVFG